MDQRGEGNWDKSPITLPRLASEIWEVIKKEDYVLTAGTPVERAHIGMDLCDPDPDFAAAARSMGWYAEGPIDQGKDVGPVLKRAITRVKAGQPALVDTITQQR